MVGNNQYLKGTKKYTVVDMINSINLPTEALQGRYYIIVVILEIMFENVSVSWHLGGWDEPANSSEINGHTFRATPSRDTWGFEFTGKIQQVRYKLYASQKIWGQVTFLLVGSKGWSYVTCDGDHHVICKFKKLCFYYLFKLMVISCVQWYP